MNIKAITILTAVILAISPISANADEHGHRNHEHRSNGINPWPFLAGAVVGGIIIHEAERPVPAPVYREGAIVYVNGVPYRYTTQCDPDYIVRDDRGNDVVVRGACRRALVPLN
jgi:hypothetical protein